VKKARKIDARPNLRTRSSCSSRDSLLSVNRRYLPDSASVFTHASVSPSNCEEPYMNCLKSSGEKLRSRWKTVFLT
jgi:hypothetical protein